MRFGCFYLPRADSYLLILSVREQANSPSDLQHARMNGIDGLKMPTTGVYLVSYGGVIDALHISFSWRVKAPRHQQAAMTSGSLREPKRRQRSGLVNYMATRSSRCIKMRMFLIRGSHLDFGLSRLLAGPIRCVFTLCSYAGQRLIGLNRTDFGL